MRMLFALLLVLAATVGLTMLAQHDPGYVLLGYGEWSIEGSLTLLLVVSGVAFVGFYLLLRLMFGTLRVPLRLGLWRRQRRALRARRATQRGLLALAEGNWPRAENYLSRFAEASDTPLLNYLGAARAAQKRGADGRRDHYLARAYQSMPDAELAVGLTQAEVQLSADQAEQALATLQHLRTIAPKHAYVLHLLRKIYERLGNWDDLLTLIPELKRQKLLDEAASVALAEQVQVQRLQVCAERLDRLQQCWTDVPKAQQQSPKVLQRYAELLLGLGAHVEAERQLHAFLKKQWNAELMTLYGRLHGEEPARQLSVAERWLKEYTHHSGLLLALARIAFRNKLWGKGRSYLEASIGAEPRAESYCELGQLLEQLGEKAAASECFRKGLELAVGENCVRVEMPPDGDRLHQHAIEQA